MWALSHLGHCFVPGRGGFERPHKFPPCEHYRQRYDLETMMAISSEPITTTDAADILGVSEERVRQLCQGGFIGRKFGNQWLLTADEVERFKPNHKRTPGPPKKSEKHD
jgi:hypothetical protein